MDAVQPARDVFERVAEARRVEVLQVVAQILHRAEHPDLRVRVQGASRDLVDPAELVDEPPTMALAEASAVEEPAGERRVFRLEVELVKRHVDDRDALTDEGTEVLEPLAGVEGVALINRRRSQGQDPVQQHQLERVEGVPFPIDRRDERKRGAKCRWHLEAQRIPVGADRMKARAAVDRSVQPSAARVDEVERRVVERAAFQHRLQDLHVERL